MSHEPGFLPPLDLGNGIIRIDTGLHRPGMVACYLLEADGHAALIDSGTWHSVPHILEVLESRALEPGDIDYVIPTHVHLDHAGGAGALMQRLPNATMIVHPFGAKHMVDPQRISQGAVAVYGEAQFRKDYHEIVPVDGERIAEAPEGFEVEFGGRKLTFVDTPGHAGHHFCVWDLRSRGFFSGDTFGISYRETDIDGRALIFPTTTPVQFKPDKWLDSLDRLEAFSPEAMYLTHFGAVREVPRLMGELRDGIEAHHAIAAETLNADDPEQAIRARLREWFMKRLEAHGIESPEQVMKDLLAIDLELNTQGLVAWQARRR